MDADLEASVACSLTLTVILTQFFPLLNVGNSFHPSEVAGRVKCDRAEHIGICAGERSTTMNDHPRSICALFFNHLEGC